ncbi:hypothetical protein Landi51_13019 [Colletotrichum acutatum]
MDGPDSIGVTALSARIEGQRSAILQAWIEKNEPRGLGAEGLLSGNDAANYRQSQGKSSKRAFYKKSSTAKEVDRVEEEDREREAGEVVQGSQGMGLTSQGSGFCGVSDEISANVHIIEPVLKGAISPISGNEHQNVRLEEESPCDQQVLRSREFNDAGLKEHRTNTVEALQEMDYGLAKAKELATSVDERRGGRSGQAQELAQRGPCELALIVKPVVSSAVEAAPVEKKTARDGRLGGVTSAAVSSSGDKSNPSLLSLDEPNIPSATGTSVNDNISSNSIDKGKGMDNDGLLSSGIDPGSLELYKEYRDAV